MDATKIGVGGHSFGAHTAQLIGRTTIGDSSQYADKRPRAFLMISPQGREGGFAGSDSVLSDKSWSNFTRPMMVITGTNDGGRHGQDYTWRLDPHQLAPEGKEYLLVIDGAYHNFGGISGARRSKGPDNPQQVALVQAASLNFWDAFLKSNQNAQAQLSVEDSLPVSCGDLLDAYQVTCILRYNAACR
jgi:hypothetical protein